MLSTTIATSTLSDRRPRFRRTSPPPMRLTEDDLIIIQHVREHRFLRSTHLVRLLQRPTDKVLRRLAALYHNGYLDRPHAQLDYYGRSGSAPIVYALGNRGAMIDATTRINWTDKNNSVQRPYIEHALMVADFMVGIECDVRHQSDIDFVSRSQISDDYRRGWTLSAKVPDLTDELSVTPDAIFALEYKRKQRRNFFIVEIDRSTMPIRRTSLRQSSFERKLLTYHYAHQQRQHVTAWGIPGFRVLTVVKSEDRQQSMIDAVRDITAGRGSNVFLFATMPRGGQINPSSMNWTTAKGAVVNLTD